ncbi:MAG TPA: hypothetical protein VGG05_22675 [Pseudonocardiaceae bacterium]
MVETRDERSLIAAGLERVYVELDWYDGPRAGLADVDGTVHYFHTDDYVAEVPEYGVWPAGEDVVALERESWAIFVRWHDRFGAGTATSRSHPGHGGIDARYDELTSLLTAHRQPPADARRLVAQWRSGSGGGRYRIGGVDYRVRWRPAGRATSVG